MPHTLTLLMSVMPICIVGLRWRRRLPVLPMIPVVVPWVLLGGRVAVIIRLRATATVRVGRDDCVVVARGRLLRRGLLLLWMCQRATRLVVPRIELRGLRRGRRRRLWIRRLSNGLHHHIVHHASVRTQRDTNGIGRRHRAMRDRHAAVERTRAIARWRVRGGGTSVVRLDSSRAGTPCR